jgi:predicted Zn-dependent protease with MMP-like domain
MTGIDVRRFWNMEMEQDHWATLMRDAESEISTVMSALPESVLRRLADLPITCELKPNTQMVAAGIHPDRTLGLFTGVPYPNAIAISQRMPPQIILFLDNIWRYAGHQPTVFRDQVQKTLLHEIGHFLGLDERGVRARGL